MVGIYKITNPKGKIYIGQSVNIEVRKSKYTSNNTQGQHKIYRSIKKHGWENHIFEIIEECNLNQLNERETYWKQYYLDYFKNDWEMVLFFSLHDAGGGPKSEEWKKSKYRPLIQYDLEGNFIQEWISGKHYAEKHGLTNGTLITFCLKGKSKTAYKSLWKYKTKNYPTKIPPVSLEYEKMKIIQCDLIGNTISEWDSILEASLSLNIKQQSIVNNLKNRSKSSGGYIWKYKN
jgi:group I intron endonuclease